ncbi:MAG: DNA alkylation repair protein [Patescibacteria group bacterium]
MSQLTSTSLIKILSAEKNQDKSVILGRFFKTGPGQYGEGDFFLGINVPVIRKIAKDFVGLSMSEIKSLITNKYHEVRLAGILVLVANYQKAKDDKEREKIFKFYLANAKKINNWDLVDLSAPNIVGDFCVRYPENFIILKKLAVSKNLWERRIAILSSFSFIKKGSFRETFELAEILLNDTQDLMHKAVGWMLREVGKRVSRKHLEDFLDKNIKIMPRTALRYAIEHFEERRRKEYLKK